MLAHLLLAHRPTEQLYRLLRQLVQPDCTVFIHVDMKSDIQHFESLIDNYPQVHLIKDRIRVNWGGFSMVEATLASLREILSTDSQYEFINLLSESDYPLTNHNSVMSFLRRHPGKSFMEYEKEGSPWWLESQARIKKFHLTDVRLKRKHFIERLLNTISPGRKIPEQMELIGRSQWFILAKHHADYILQVVDEKPIIRQFFRYTWGADEFFFQTLLYNSPFRNEIINDNLRYIDWSESQPGPKILTIKDFEALKNSGKFYARKFDARVDSLILDRLDELINSKAEQAASK